VRNEKLLFARSALADVESDVDARPNDGGESGLSDGGESGLSDGGESGLSDGGENRLSGARGGRLIIAAARHIARLTWLLGRRVLLGVLFGLLVESALAKLSFTVELGHRGLLVPACHACPPAVGTWSEPTAPEMS
jgi:hypothetical protein